MKKLCMTMLRMITLLIAISIIAFLMVSHAPMDPLTAYIGDRKSTRLNSSHMA